MYTVETLSAHLKPIAEAYHLCDHPFMVRFARGGFDADQIRWWAKKMLPGSNRFNQSFLMATAMASDVRDRVILLDNVYSEHGYLKAGQTHVELYMRFMAAIGCKNISVYEDDGSSRIPALAFKRFRIDPSQETLPDVLARFLAIETVLPDLFPQYINGLRNVFQPDDRAIEYFHIHSELDPEHQADLLTVICRHIETDEELNGVKQNFGLIFKQLVDMFDYMLEELDRRPWTAATEKELVGTGH